MQALARAAATEFAPGNSTGVVVWAGSGGCPDCRCAPIVHCGGGLPGHEIQPNHFSHVHVIIVGALFIVPVLLGLRRRVAHRDRRPQGVPAVARLEAKGAGEGLGSEMALVGVGAAPPP